MEREIAKVSPSKKVKIGGYGIDSAGNVKEKYVSQFYVYSFFVKFCPVDFEGKFFILIACRCPWPGHIFIYQK